MPELEDPAAMSTTGSADVVLVVDDVPDNITLLNDALDEAGYMVLVATSGEAALSLAARAHPDIVLLDAVMPGLDGFEVARRLRADPVTAGIPIVFMTGLTETEHVVAAFAAGGTDYVTKPIKPREVLARKMLAEHFGGDDANTPPEVIAWVAREALRRRAGADPATLTVARGSRRITFALHAMPEETVEDASDGEWLVVMRESDDASVVEAVMLNFKITAREAEVLYWVVKGKTNRDIGDILGMSPRTVNKHLEHVYEKLGVETRAAAAALAMRAESD